MFIAALDNNTILSVNYTLSIYIYIKKKEVNSLGNSLQSGHLSLLLLLVGTPLAE